MHPVGKFVTTLGEITIGDDGYECTGVSHSKR